MVKAGIAPRPEKAAVLLDFNRTLKKQSYKVQLTRELSNYPYKVDCAILGTRAGPNLIPTVSIDECWRTSINFKMPRGQRSADGTPLRVVEESGRSHKSANKSLRRVF